MSVGKKYFARDATGFVRQLTARDVFIANMTGPGTSLPFVFAFLAELLYPGVNLPFTVLLILVIGLFGGLLYYIFSVAMPRTGADYVWNSRILHPSVGFAISFALGFTLLAAGGIFASWVPIYGLNPMFSSLGIIYSNPNLISLAKLMLTPAVSWAVTMIVLIIITLVTLLGTKAFFRFVVIAFLISIVGILVTIFAFLSTPNSVFISNFNRLSGMNYANTISTAGLPLGFTVAATFAGSIFTVFNFVGFNYSSYYSGEVKRVERNQLVGILGGMFGFAAVNVVIFLVAYYTIGPEFLKAVSSLAGSGNSYYNLSSAPVLNFLVVFATPNAIIAILASSSLFINLVPAVAVTNFFSPIKMMFAWSFDGLMPKAISSVGSRWGSPYVATLIAALAWVIFATLGIYANVGIYLTFAISGELLVFVVLGIAAIVLPYRRKDIYDASHPIVKKKIGGIPLIAFLGLACIISYSYLIYASFLPAVTPLPTVSPLVILGVYVYVPLLIIAGFIIYTLAFAYRKSKGVDLALTFREIPPE